MPPSPDQVRELAAYGEGTTLDFKRDQYDWTRPGINAELAKDLMAIANSLRFGGPDGYILIGVLDDGTIVGIPPTAHVDDADLHQRVTNLLNRTPEFTYSIVEVGGLSIGVFTIQPGNRPFFPVRDSPPLRRRVPLHRNGTTTDVASPLHVVEWANEDDPSAARLRSLELEEREAERRIHALLEFNGMSLAGGDGNISLLLSNLGRRVITATQLRCWIAWTPDFDRALKQAMDIEFVGFTPQGVEPWLRGETPPGYAPPSAAFPLAEARIVTSPGGTSCVNVPWRNALAIEHFQQHRLPLDRFEFNWARFHFEVDLDGELGSSG